MNKNIFFQIFITGMFFLKIQSGLSQVVNDAGLWENIYLEKKITSKWNIHLNHEGRINQNITRFYYAYADMGMTHIFNKHVKLVFDYVLGEKRLKTDFWSMRHQAYIALILKQKIGPFTISVRIMPQIDYSDMYSSEHGMLPKYHFRNKLTLKYNQNSRFTPYVASEIYYNINAYSRKNLPQGEQFDRMRYFAGIFYEVNKRNQLEFYYLYENNFNQKKATNNFVTGIGYAHYF